MDAFQKTHFFHSTYILKDWLCEPLISSISWEAIDSVLGDTFCIFLSRLLHSRGQYVPSSLRLITVHPCATSLQRPANNSLTENADNYWKPARDGRGAITWMILALQDRPNCPIVGSVTVTLTDPGQYLTVFVTYTGNTGKTVTRLKPKATIVVIMVLCWHLWSCICQVNLSYACAQQPLNFCLLLDFMSGGQWKDYSN